MFDTESLTDVRTLIDLTAVELSFDDAVSDTPAVRWVTADATVDAESLPGGAAEYAERHGVVGQMGGWLVRHRGLPLAPAFSAVDSSRLDYALSVIDEGGVIDDRMVIIWTQMRFVGNPLIARPLLQKVALTTQAILGIDDFLMVDNMVKWEKAGITRSLKPMSQLTKAYPTFQHVAGTLWMGDINSLDSGV